MGSPNVIKMLDYYHKADHTYIITEFCDHGNFQIYRRPPRKPDQTQAANRGGGGDQNPQEYRPRFLRANL